MSTANQFEKVHDSRNRRIRGLWRRNKTFYAQMRVDGASSPRRVKLKHATTVAQAIDAMQAARVRRAEGVLVVEAPGLEVTFGALVAAYLLAQCPDSGRRVRAGSVLEQEEERVGRLAAWTGWDPVSRIRNATLDQYAAWRKEKSKRMRNGRRITQEMFTLKNIFRFALRTELITVNPLAKLEFTDYQWSPAVRSKHRRPQDAEELHKLARWMFQRQDREVFGWQLLIEAFTGIRTSEALACRTDARAGEPGFRDGQYLHLARKKQGVNPWAKIHPALADCFKVFDKWHTARHPESPWYFPSPYDDAKTVHPTSLVHVLKKACKALKIKNHITSHGMRSYYATARRSELVEDAVIAAEMGDSSGAMIIVHTYGGLPPNWQQTNAGKISWLPKGKPAWSIFK
jgi:integrase